MTTYAVIAIVLLFAMAAMFRAFNGPKTAAEKTAQEIEQTKQELQRQEARQKVIDARIAARQKKAEERRRKPRP